jgi:hypothetical protein
MTTTEVTATEVAAAEVAAAEVSTARGRCNTPQAQRPRREACRHHC